MSTGSASPMQMGRYSWEPWHFGYVARILALLDGAGALLAPLEVRLVD